MKAEARHLDASVAVPLMALLAIVLLQNSVTSHFTVDGVRPDLVLLAVVDWGLVRGLEEGMLWGLLGGALMDVSSGLPFGTSSLAYVSIAGMVSLGESALLRTHVLLPIIAAAAGTVIYYAIAVVVVASVRHQVTLDGSTLRTFAGVAVFNAVINPVIYVAAQWFDRKLHPIARTVW